MGEYMPGVDWQVEIIWEYLGLSDNLTAKFVSA